MNAIGGDNIQMLQAAVKEASLNFTALAVGNDLNRAGANLMLLLPKRMRAPDDVDLMIRGFRGRRWR